MPSAGRTNSRGVRALILRLYRGRASLARVDEVAAMVSGRFIEAASAMPGLTSFAAGMRIDEDAVRVVLATTWEDLGDVVRQTQGHLDQPAGPVPDFMETEGTEHLELVSEPVPMLVASPDALVRVARMKVRPGQEETFYGIVRRRLAEVRPTGNLLAYHLGRKVGEGHEAVAVSVWRSIDALGEMVSPESGAPLWQEELQPLLSSFEVEHFDAVIVRRH